MKLYIYDLDNTLHSQYECEETDDEEKYYASFKKKKFLKHLMKNTKPSQFIFTNGNYSHAALVLKKLGLHSLFPKKRITSSDMFAYKYKPLPESYKKAIERFNISADDEVYFFEDTPENLEAAKQLNWKTILVGDNSKIKEDYIDWKFRNIEEALLFFKIKDVFGKK